MKHRILKILISIDFLLTIFIFFNFYWDYFVKYHNSISSILENRIGFIMINFTCIPITLFCIYAWKIILKLKQSNQGTSQFLFISFMISIGILFYIILHKYFVLDENRKNNTLNLLAVLIFCSYISLNIIILFGANKIRKKIINNNVKEEIERIGDY